MVILGLGSNIGDRYQHLRTAVDYLKNLGDIIVEKISPVYESEALIPPDYQEKTIDRNKQVYDWDLPYLNIAVKISTQLSPSALIIELKNIEKTMAREPAARWYPRTIDIDILAWGNTIINETHLNIPHIGLEYRPFALWPLFDVAPDWIHPVLNKSVRDLVKPWGDKFSGLAPLKTRQVNADLSKTALVGIINVTPDSFSDAGLCFTPENALLKAKKCIDEGASILDIGAESTRPGAVSIAPEEEWQRLLPVLQLLKSELPSAKLSIDTRHPETAEKALHLGIHYLNDVMGFSNPRMRDLARNASIPIIFMHSLSVPADQQILIPSDQDPVRYIFDWAQQQIDLFLQEGFLRDNLIFDVGIGFGNSAAQAIAILKNIEVFHRLGVKLFVGHSRKSFLKSIESEFYRNRDVETAIISGILAKKHIHFLRVHEIAVNQIALTINGEGA